MSNRNEFDDLIKDYRLGDKEFSAPKRPRARAFDYEQQAPVAGNPSDERRVAVQARLPEKRRSFQVRIDESEFYEPEAVGVSKRGGGGGIPDDPDDGDEGGGFSRWFKAIIALVVVLCVSVFLAFFVLENASDLFGLNQPDVEIEFVLPKDQTMAQVASLLYDKQVITQKLTFQLYAGLKSKAENYIPGTYMLNSKMSYDEILIKFQSGSIKRVEVTVMFYEGMTLSEIADALEKAKVCSKDELFEYLDKADFPWQYRFLEQVPDPADRFRRYEGYFFPDTYIFYEGMSPMEVTRKFFSNFNNKMTDEMYEQMEKMGMTLDETIILASIIQREVANTKDMRLVSSVFHNRLNNPSVFPNLQSDTTREYVDSDIKPYLDEPDQALYDSYNSDMGKRVGLPAGAICNPGKDAIEAALNPTQSGYYFFVTDVEGIAYYAVTDAEHERNKAIARAKGELHGINVENSN